MSQISDAARVNTLVAIAFAVAHRVISTLPPDDYRVDFTRDMVAPQSGSIGITKKNGWLPWTGHGVLAIDANFSRQRDGHEIHIAIFGGCEIERTSVARIYYSEAMKRGVIPTMIRFSDQNGNYYGHSPDGQIHQGKWLNI